MREKRAAKSNSLIVVHCHSIVDEHFGLTVESCLSVENDCRVGSR
jgi:hypothetical protein